jgi:hypothetical protein
VFKNQRVVESVGVSFQIPLQVAEIDNHTALFTVHIKVSGNRYLNFPAMTVDVAALSGVSGKAVRRVKMRARFHGKHEIFPDFSL